MLATPVHVDIRAGAVAGLVELLEERRVSSRGRVAVALGPGLGERVLDSLAGSIPLADVCTVGGGTVDDALALADAIGRKPVDAVVGIGGGRTLDVAKYAASRVGAPMVSVATSLAHDGIASPVSVLEVDGRRHSFGVSMPIGVVVDLDFVRTAPRRQIRAGVADAVSNLSALADWRLATAVTGEPFDGLAATFAGAAAESVLHSRSRLDSDHFLTTLAEALVLSGLAMSVAGTSRPCSGACHEISHAIDKLRPGLASHGEQVGVGALFATFLRGDDELFDDLLRCLLHVDAAVTPAALGLSPEVFTLAVLEAPSTRPDRYTILEHLALAPSETHERVVDFVRAVESRAGAVAVGEHGVSPALA
ncbi:MAG TPA: iron-containing alcohol dehydrogenase family protein [Acidimicrobiales bacterium]|nr:iron-containing alcohol dehydrogenase family protein [Acidimicrobiales bacterium]